MILIAVFLIVILNMNNSYADVITQNIVNGCNDSYYMLAIIEPNKHDCNSGYYLPANVDYCVACPYEHTCSGGTYYFNETTNQGIVYNSIITQNVAYGCDNSYMVFDVNYMVAQFQPNEHVCANGYYLPANVDACAICPNGYTCSGGTYSFNPDTDQGIVVNTISLTWNTTDDVSGGTGGASYCAYGEPIGLPTTPTRTGYTFMGWEVTGDN